MAIIRFSHNSFGFCCMYVLCFMSKTRNTFTAMKWIYYLVVILVFILMNLLVDAIFGCWQANVLLIMGQAIAFAGTLLITNQNKNEKDI